MSSLIHTACYGKYTWLELHAQALKPLNAVPCILNQDAHQLRIALLVAAVEGLLIVEIHTVVSCQSGLAAVVNGVQRAACQSGVAAHVACLLNNDNALAFLAGCHCRRHTCAACADNNYIRGQLFILSHYNLRLDLLKCSHVSACLLHTVGNAFQDGGAGQSRPCHRVDAKSLKLDDLSRQRITYRLADPRSLLMVQLNGCDAVGVKGDVNGHLFHAGHRGAVGAWGVRPCLCCFCFGFCRCGGLRRRSSLRRGSISRLTLAGGHGTGQGSCHHKGSQTLVTFFHAFISPFYFYA